MFDTVRYQGNKEYFLSFLYEFSEVYGYIKDYDLYKESIDIIFKNNPDDIIGFSCSPDKLYSAIREIVKLHESIENGEIETYHNSPEQVTSVDISEYIKGLY